jgi:hypothetical protein
MLVPGAALSAFGNNNSLPGLRHIQEYPPRLLVFYKRSRRNLYYKVAAAFAGTVRRSARFDVICKVFLFVFKVDQRPEALVDHKYDVSALSAVSSVRSAGCDILLPMEGDLSVAAIPGFYMYLGPVYEHNPFPFRGSKSRGRRAPLDFGLIPFYGMAGNKTMKRGISSLHS